MSAHTAAGVTFRAYDQNYLACNDCDGLVARPGFSMGVAPEEHSCRR